jgi:hypothetical protein
LFRGGEAGVGRSKSLAELDLVQGLGFRVQGVGFRVKGVGFGVQGLWFMVQVSGVRV